MNYKTLSRLHDVTQAYGIGTKLAIAVAYLGHKAGSAPFMDLKEAGILPDYIKATKDIAPNARVYLRSERRTVPNGYHDATIGSTLHLTTLGWELYRKLAAVE